MTSSVKRELRSILGSSLLKIKTNQKDSLNRNGLFAELAKDQRVTSALTTLYGQLDKACPDTANKYTTSNPCVGDFHYVIKNWETAGEDHKKAVRQFIETLLMSAPYSRLTNSGRANAITLRKKFGLPLPSEFKEHKPQQGGQSYIGQPTPSDTGIRHVTEKTGDAIVPSNLSEEQGKGELEGKAHPDALMSNQGFPIEVSIHESNSDLATYSPGAAMNYSTNLTDVKAEVGTKLMEKFPTKGASGYKPATSDNKMGKVATYNKEQQPMSVPYATINNKDRSREEGMVAAADSQTSTTTGAFTAAGQQQLNVTSYLTNQAGTGGKTTMGGQPNDEPMATNIGGSSLTSSGGQPVIGDQVSTIETSSSQWQRGAVGAAAAIAASDPSIISSIMQTIKGLIDTGTTGSVTIIDDVIKTIEDTVKVGGKLSREILDKAESVFNKLSPESKDKINEITHKVNNTTFTELVQHVRAPPRKAYKLQTSISDLVRGEPGTQHLKDKVPFKEGTGALVETGTKGWEPIYNRPGWYRNSETGEEKMKSAFEDLPAQPMGRDVSQQEKTSSMDVDVGSLGRRIDALKEGKKKKRKAGSDMTDVADIEKLLGENPGEIGDTLGVLKKTRQEIARKKNYYSQSSQQGKDKFKAEKKKLIKETFNWRYSRKKKGGVLNSKQLSQLEQIFDREEEEFETSQPAPIGPDPPISTQTQASSQETKVSILPPIQLKGSATQPPEPTRTSADTTELDKYKAAQEKERQDEQKRYQEGISRAQSQAQAEVKHAQTIAYQQYRAAVIAKSEAERLKREAQQRQEEFTAERMKLENELAKKEREAEKNKDNKQANALTEQQIAELTEHLNVLNDDLRKTTETVIAQDKRIKDLSKGDKPAVEPVEPTGARGGSGSSRGLSSDAASMDLGGDRDPEAMSTIDPNLRIPSEQGDPEKMQDDEHEEKQRDMQALRLQYGVPPGWDPTKLIDQPAQPTSGTSQVYTPMLRLMMPEGGANVVLQVNNSEEAQKINRYGWQDFNNYQWEANEEVDNDLHAMNIIDETRRFYEPLDKEEFIRDQAAAATEETYNMSQEIFTVPQNALLDGDSLVYDTRGDGNLRPYTEQEADTVFHDVYMDAWAEIPEESAWKQFTAVEGSQIYDSILQNPERYAARDNPLLRFQNDFIVSTLS